MMTIEHLAAAILVMIARSPESHTIAVATNDTGRLLAHAALLGGEIDGYVHVFDTSEGFAIAQQSANPAIDAWLAAQLNKLMGPLGAREVQHGGAA